MNHAYRLVWSDLFQRFVAVPETARSRGKRGGAVLLAAAALSGAALAGPTGGAVSSGSGTISQSGNTTTITQGSQNMAINWASFNVGSGESVKFVQPGASSIALNRVLGTDASSINGSLTANGQVWILNPNGVLFGNGASVNVGGLVASTLSLSDSDFAAGKASFSGNGSQGSVVNQGSLTGGYVALLGKQVSNSGTISTPNGTAALAAGDKVTLDFSGSQLLSVTVDEGTLNALAENKGLIRADNGSVLLSATAKNALMDTVVNNEGVIEARGIAASGGKIILLGGFDGGTVKAGGTLDASSVNHDGGFIETSGAHVQVADGAQISTLSQTGKTGTWLVDPTDFTIAAGSGAQTSSGIGASTLATNLASNNVTLTTDNSTGTDSGDINVNAAVSWSANTTLTLNAYNNVNLNAAITATGAAAGLALNYGGDYNVNAPVTLSGTNATLSLNGNAYTLIHSMAELQSADDHGLLALAQDLDASGTVYGDAVIGTFFGTLAGLGHTVHQFNVAGAGSLAGLIGQIRSSAVVRDLSLVGGSVQASGPGAGALAGLSDGTILNVHAAVDVHGGDDSGGLVGYNTGRITRSDATGTVTGANDTGGLIGRNDGNLDQVWASGNVTGASYVGGLVGLQTEAVTLNNAHASGDVSGNFNVGGLVGLAYNSSVFSNVYATGDVTGLTGSVGGLVGHNDASFIINAFATGKVKSAGGEGVGGLIGSANYDSKVVYAYATGDVSGDSRVGGLMGEGAGSLTDVYASGHVSAGYQPGGLIGGFDGYYPTVTNGYWNLETTGQSSSLGGGTGLSSAQMMQASSFSGWDLASSGGSNAVWRIYEGQSAPLLRSFMPALTVSADSVSKVYDGTVNFSGGGYATSDAGADRSLILGTAVYGDASSKNVGSYSIGLSGLYSNQFGYDLTLAAGTAKITAATLTVSGSTAASKTYDGTTLASVSGGSLGGVLAGDSVSLSQSGTFSDKNAGSGKAVTVTGSLSGSDAGNYVVAASSATADITAATLTLSGTTAASKTYDGSTAASLSGSLNGVFAGDAVALSQSGNFSDKNAGGGKTVSYTSSLLGADAGNYVLTSGTGITSADIHAATLTVAGTAAASKTYDATTSASVSGGMLQGVVAGDNVVLDQSGSFGDKNAGRGKTVSVVNSVSGADAGNYILTITTASALADITAATLTISGSTAANKTYDGTTLASVSGGSLNGVLAGDSIGLSQMGSFSDKNAGSGKTVTVTNSLAGNDAGNYVLTSPVTSVAADIFAAQLQVSGAQASSKTYDGKLAAQVSGGSLVGVLAGDSLAFDLSGSFSDKNVGIGKTVSITGTLHGTDAGNYVLGAQAGTAQADISAATVFFSGGTALSKAYDGSTAASVSGGSLSGLIDGDLVTVNQSGSFGDKNVGYGKQVSVSRSLAGTDAGNYLLVNPATVLASDITPKLLSIDIVAADKTYDGSARASVTGSLGGVVAGDAVAVYLVGYFDDKNVGTNKTVSLGLSLLGTDAGNYTFNRPGASTASITAATLTVNGSVVANKTYDGTTQASIGGGTLQGLVEGDDISLSQSASFADKNAGAAKTVNQQFAIAGVDAANYVLANATGTTTADIAAASLAVSGSVAANKTYDGTTAAAVSGGQLRGVIAGDSVTLSQSGTFADKNAGLGKVVTVTNSLGGDDAGNYLVANDSSSANIAQALLTVTGAKAQDKVFDGTKTATVTGGTLTGLVAGDDVALSQTGRFLTALWGHYKPVVETFAISGADAQNYQLTKTQQLGLADVFKPATVTVAQQLKLAALLKGLGLTVLEADAAPR
ncbi:MAG TPA: YDG domain-containing protein [Ideonella sp.]|uniref:YDG domain-containing protein n=1 Tax=Ideonella sp. TaxID=1929293 RepID=UPI002C7C73F9|nr:YDG domain-containing protein [Ideonella sp.]HSI46691.1 YDG domain-containing protein [Ideonella sp.]